MNKALYTFTEELKVETDLLICHARKHTLTKKFTEWITNREKPRIL